MESTAVYIHWPFCKSKCPYCDFNSHVRDSVDYDDFLSAYLKEIRYFEGYLKDREITSIFFGGGTPSLAPVKLVEKIINELSKYSNFASDIEISLEANPTSVEIEKFKYLSAVGVNRISIGIQSFCNKELKFLGREHSAEEALYSLDIARKYFSNYSFDLIYTLPNQTIRKWTESLQRAISEVEKHISLYQLTIEKGTPFFSDHKKKKFIMKKADASLKFYEVTKEICKSYNLLPYEVSNYAKYGYESKHNMSYWKGKDYLGIGPGAHGRVTMHGIRYESMMYHLPERWLKTVKEKNVGYQRHCVMSKELILRERIMMSLRISEGIELEHLDMKKVNMLLDLSLLEIVGKKVRCTEKGITVLDSIIHFLS